MGWQNGLEDGTNPIQRKPAAFTGYGNEVIIEILEDDAKFEAKEKCIDTLLIAIQAQEVLLLFSQALNLYYELCEAHNETDRQIIILKHSLAHMDNNVPLVPLGPQSSKGGIWGYLLT